jgi:hypothetical protein
MDAQELSTINFFTKCVKIFQLFLMNRLKTNKCIRTTVFNKLSYQVRHTLMWARKFPLELFIVERVFPILGQSFT